jgi:uncharacterized protein (TIGR00369 family)
MTSSEPHRTRTITWDDPMTTAEAGKHISGLDFLNRMLAGELPHPPIAQTLDFTLESAAEGKATFVVTPAEYHYNPIGVVHGGLAATLLDSALGCAIQSTLPAGVGYTTLELHVNLVRAITHDVGRLRAVAEVVHAGRTIGTAQARLVGDDGKLYAHGTTTCMIFRASQ